MLAATDARELRLLNDYQRQFPLVHAPYAEIAERLGVDEDWVCDRLGRWQREGRVSRVGGVFRPRAIGVSTLATMAVPERDLARVAEAVSARPEVNHNYEREHRFNLWFVLTAADTAALHAALDAIRRETGYTPLSLPLLADYWIDLGFDLEKSASSVRDVPAGAGAGCRESTPSALSPVDRRVISALEEGLPLVPAPYAAIAAAAGVKEDHVVSRIARWLDDGVIKRLGIIVRHRELGYTANAMCVWDVPDAEADALGEKLARETAVSLCARRGRSSPEWRYNLYCIVHGRDRAQVERQVADMAAWHGLDRFPSAVLFSKRRFKQRGARYCAAGAASVGSG
jgi:DNA-binding Lrp family transcriptional regulator